MYPLRNAVHAFVKLSWNQIKMNFLSCFFLLLKCIHGAYYYYNYKFVQKLLPKLSSFSVKKNYIIPTLKFSLQDRAIRYYTINNALHGHMGKLRATYTHTHYSKLNGANLARVSLRFFLVPASFLQFKSLSSQLVWI